MPAAIGGIFLTSAFAATATGAFVAGVIGSAVIGAAVGGLTAAVTGGDIGKGLLFGAVGGAVLGGITGAMGGFGGTVASTSVAMGENAVGAMAAQGTTASAAISGVTSGASQAFGVGKYFATQGGGMMGAALVTTAGTTLAGAFDDSAEQAAKLEREKMAQQDKQFYANLEAQKDIAGIQSGGGGGSDAIGVARINQETQREQLAEQRRQYNTENALKEASRARRAGALSGLTAAKEAGQIAPAAPSIDQQAYNESTQMYADPTAVAAPLPPPEERGVLG